MYILGAKVAIIVPNCVGRMVKDLKLKEKCIERFPEVSVSREYEGSQTILIITSADKIQREVASKWLEEETRNGQETLTLPKQCSIEDGKKVVERYMKAVVVREIQKKHGQKVLIFWDIVECDEQDKVQAIYCNNEKSSINDEINSLAKALRTDIVDLYQHVSQDDVITFIQNARKMKKIFLDVVVYKDAMILFYDKRNKASVDSILSNAQDHFLKLPAPSESSRSSNQPSSSTTIGVQPGNSLVTYQSVKHQKWLSPNQHELVIAQMRAETCQRDVLVYVTESDNGNHIFCICPNLLIKCSKPCQQFHVVLHF